MAESADQDDDAGTQAAGERPAPATDGESTPPDGADTDSTATDDLDPAERRCGISLGGDE